jgi:hypothetical protein
MMRLVLAPVIGSILLASSLSACGGSGTVPGVLGVGGGGGGGAGGGGGNGGGNGAGGGGGDVDAGFDSGVDPHAPYPAPHPAAPSVVSASGPVLTAPVIVPIMPQGYAFQNDIQTFTSTLGQQSYWATTTSEYGVGNITALPPVVVPTSSFPGLSGTNPIQDQDIQNFLTSEFQSGALTANPQQIYAVYFPDTVTISDGQGTSCKDFGGYHSEIDINGTPLSYAVLPACQNFDGLNLSEVNGITGGSSHEFVEAATDPYVQSSPAYASVADSNLVWAILGGGIAEVGDMCAQFVQLDPSIFFTPSGFNYAVQRTWSNKSAAASHDPCVPAPSTPYFNSAPVLSDQVSVTCSGQQGSIPTTGVQIPIGSSKTIEVDLFSDAPTAPWTVSAVDLNQALGAASPSLTFSFDNASGQNGDKLHLTITVQNAGPGTPCTGEGFVLVSQQGNQKATAWVGLVSQ